MSRVVLEAVAIFLSPILAYAAFLYLGRQWPVSARSWSRATLGLLTIAGLVLAAALILGGALLSEQHAGAYLPAHVVSGRLVPGSFK